jgi:hypothetical protein
MKVDIPPVDENEEQDVITLNVGGTIFQSTRTTLTTKSSFFQRMLTEQDNPLYRKKRVYFLDRDPLLFEGVLGVMRSGKASFSVVGKNEKECAEELAFYGIVVIKKEEQQVEIHTAFCGKWEYAAIKISITASPSFLFFSSVGFARSSFCACVFTPSVTDPGKTRWMVLNTDKTRSWGLVGDVDLENMRTLGEFFGKVFPKEVGFASSKLHQTYLFARWTMVSGTRRKSLRFKGGEKLKSPAIPEDMLSHFRKLLYSK